MNLKNVHRRILQFALSLVVVGATTSCQGGETSKGTSKSSPSSMEEKASTSAASKTHPTSVNNSVAQSDTVKKEQRKLVVYYLHGTYRCYSCNTIERLTKQAVETGFVSQIKDGRVELKVLNVEEKGNEHFVEDYKLYTKSVILSDTKNNKETRWKNLDQVWTLLGNEGKFIDYIQKEVRSYLEG